MGRIDESSIDDLSISKDWYNRLKVTLGKSILQNHAYQK